MLDVSRKELKYLLTLSQAHDMMQKLSEIMEMDVHGGADGYLVRSLYFDTLFDSDFEDKVAGYDKRQKIRLRAYGADTDTIKLELKEKEGSGQRKRSLLLTRQEALQMIAEDYTFLMERPEPLSHWLYAFMTTKLYRPKCIVEYDRVAYYRNENDIRVTFDCNLRALEADFESFLMSPECYPVSSLDEVTMEVKYNGFLYTYIKQMISGMGQMQSSNSKYCRARSLTKHGRR